MKKCVLVLIELTLFFICSCQKQNHQLETAKQDFVEKSRIAVTNELYQEKAVEASKVMLEMRKKNQLPGMVIGDHGTMTSDYFDLMESNNVIEVTYPLSQIFRFVKTGETCTNNYLFQRLSKNTPWRLTRAWEADPSGKIINEWPVK